LQQFVAARDAPPGQQAERRELLLRVAAAIDQLPEDQRDVIIQRDLLGTPVAEVAALLGRTPKSVAGLLLRGRRRLRELLSEYQ
jgi:RNA polymerase sigma-70 factor (ECF subfamily)